MGGDIDEIVVELDRVLEAGADSGEPVFQVLERLCRLGPELPGASSELAGRIDSGLARDVDSAAGAGHLDYVGVARRPLYGRRIDEAKVGRGCALGQRWRGGARSRRGGDCARQDVAPRCGSSLRLRRAGSRQGVLS